MLGIVLLLLAVALMFRLGFGLFAILIKLMLVFAGLLMAGIAAVGAIGLALLICGTVGIGLVMLFAGLLAPLWLPLLLFVLVIRALTRPSASLAA
jgi:hypothetical protein